MKKITFLMVALAAQVAQAAHPFTGGYVSAAAGGTVLDLEVDHTLTAFSAGFVDALFPADNNAEAIGGAGWLALGYSHEFNHHFVLGIEATAGLANPDVIYEHAVIVDGNSISSQIETQLKNDFALLFKPGYVVKHHTQIYGFVGPRWGNFKSNLTTDLIEDIVEDTVSAYELGVTAGLGVTCLITNHLSLGLEYAYTHYGDITSPETMSQAFIPGLGVFAAVTDDPDLEVSTNTVAAQLTYHFM